MKSAESNRSGLLPLPTRSKLFYGWIVVAVSFVILFTSNGVQQSFGVFFKPMLLEFGWDRASLSLAASINSLAYGVSQPIIGKIVDQRGARIVIFGGTSLLVIAITAMMTTTGLWHVYLLYGLLGGVGVGALSTVTLSTLVATWFNRHRGLALSITAAGVSAGQFTIIPSSAALILALGWRTTWAVLGLMLLILLPIAFWLLKNRPADVGLLAYGDSADQADRIRGTAGAKAVPKPEKKTSIRKATRSLSFWMLALEFFVCGVTGSMMLTHLVPAAIDKGMSEMVAANALGLLGGFSVIGVLIIGAISDRVGRKVPLSAIYLTRGIALLYLTTVDEPVGLMIFTALYGVARVASVPLTSALCAEIFGRGSMGTIFGVVFLSHQMGGAIGAYAAGRIFDSTGSYSLAFTAAAITGFIASVGCLFIKEERSPRRSVSTTISGQKT